AGLGEAVPDRSSGAVAVVGEDVGHDRPAGRTVAVVADLLQPLAGERPRPPLDGVFDLVGRHVDLTRLLHRQPQAEVAIRVAPALARRDRDLTARAGERMAPFGVDAL